MKGHSVKVEMGVSRNRLYLLIKKKDMYEKKMSPL